MPIGRLIVITTWGDSLHCNDASIVSSKGRGGRRCCSVNWSYTECTNAFVAECIDLLSPLLCAFLMISEMLLLQKQGAAFPQPSRAIYCGKVIISLRLKKKKRKKKEKWTEWSACQNVGSEPETAAVLGGTASRFQSSFTETRHWLEEGNKSSGCLFAETHHDNISQNPFDRLCKD